MKKLINGLFFVIFIALILILTYFNIGLNSTITISAVLIIIYFFLLFEFKGIDSKKLAVISTMAAMGGVFRIPFAGVPNVQPTTFIVAVSGYTLGSVEGFIVGVLSAFISNFFLGHGPWTLWQMLGWGLCGVFFGVLRKLISNYNIVIFTIFCGLWGFIYGIILDMWFVVGFIRPLTINAVLLGVASSLVFDSMHAIGNIIFSILFSNKFVKILDRFIKRFEVEYID
ncbi:ECF transporter S component [Caloramator australicus]|uniref:Substrate-specific component CbrT of predicted cobalamin ECF transporter n=3 Tax=Caloramator TaxID=44258 RepID=I7LI13_9CLOT|nr:ECF transporter S component [Caloramator australicus]CCJ34453.1 Substrate-specific component CbrT of predicted cobalamin ECF transporter [Caloramator australicus RC3]